MVQRGDREKAVQIKREREPEYKKRWKGKRDTDKQG